MKRRRLVVASLAACVAAPVRAHAFLEHAEPRVGSVVKTAPSELRLSFSEPIEGAFSTAKVLDAAGRRVDKGDVRVEPAERGVLRVSLLPLAAGAYTVQWRAVSVDTHVTTGSFGFRIAP
ncbi:MAG: copper resistance protein CopC [Rhizobacter sp.]|nr:copper resistance protein CopC [Rhizobacter sp.]